MALFFTFVLAFVVAMFMAWSIGANSNSSPFAPAVGAQAIPVHRAALLVGLFASVGAVAQGASISGTVGKGLVLGETITPLAATAGLVTSASFITVGVRKGYPIPAAFTVTGAMVGVGIALGGDPAYGTYLRIGAVWLAIPLIGGSIAFATAHLLRRKELPETVSIPLLGALVAFVMSTVEMSFIPAGGSLASFLAGQFGPVPPLVVAAGIGIAGGLVVRRYVERDVHAGVNGFLVLMGAVVAFSSGGSQVGLATGPLEAVFTQMVDASPIYLLVAGGVAILVGSWTGAPRLIHAVSREYSSLGPRRSIAALVPAFLIAQMAIFLGVPISFNEIIISSIIGSGLVEGGSNVSRKKIGYTVGAWLFSIVAACVVGFVLYLFLDLVY